jgi:Protein of unknown function (DUF1571).
MAISKLYRLILVFTFGVNLSFGQDAVSISQQMFSTVKSIKSVQYTFNSKERVANGKIHEERSTFKVNVAPFKLYMYQYVPKKDLQVLYVSGQNGGKAKVNPGSFPWVNLNLEPEGDLMLQDRHHGIFDAGFGYTISLLEYLMNKYPDQKDQLIKYNGVYKLQGVDCYYLTFTNPNYKLITYVAGFNETPISIAKKNHLNFYSIIDNNKSLKPTEVIKPGTKLQIPNDYALKMELLIHKDKLYPVHLKIYDHKGVYEEYYFQQVTLNPPFKDIDFSEKNPDYKF